MYGVIMLLLVTNTYEQTLYNHDRSNSYRNESWMGTLDDGIPLRKLNIFGTHCSMSDGDGGDAFQMQSLSLATQLRTGVRALDLRLRHTSSQLIAYDRFVNLDFTLSDILQIVQSFLNSFPTQVVLVHIVEEYSSTTNFEDTFITYKNSYSNLIWEVTTQNPTLGATRGKVVIIQDFTASQIHGLLFASFKVVNHKQYGTNWDQYDKWLEVKKQINDAHDKGESYLTFWTGSVGSMPYFVASGKISPQNGAPRLSTGLTTPGFKNRYPDFPRVACFSVFCTIAFEGINILAYNYIVNQNKDYVGILFTDFFGDDLINKIISLNANLFGKCTSTQTTQGCTVCSLDGDCIVCDEQNHYVFDSINSDCDAAVGYYINASSYAAQLCYDAMPGCLQCDSETICTKCDGYIHYTLENNTCVASAGYYLDSDSIPTQCDINGCYLCSSASVCTECSTGNNYQMDNNGDCICNATLNFVESGSTCVCNSGFYLENSTCQPIPNCPDLDGGCATCSGSTCITCDSNRGFIDDSPDCACDVGYYYSYAGVNSICQLCSVSLSACVQCSSSVVCTDCVDNFTLSEGECVCLTQYYRHDDDTCFSCAIGCLDCSSSTICLTCNTTASFVLIANECKCDTGKFLSGEECLACGEVIGCVDCDLHGCTECDSVLGFTLGDGECYCDPGHYPDVMGVCAECPQDGCVQCDSATVCTLCDESIFYLQQSECEQICGDGVLYFLQCDDGNTVDGDGCSSGCQVQEDYECVGGSTISASACSFTGTITISLQSMLKVSDENKVKVILIISPILQRFKNINFSTCVVTNFPYSTKEAEYDAISGQIRFDFMYDESLNTADDMELTFDPPDTPEFYYTAAVKVGMPYATDNNLGLKYYDPAVYELVPTITTLVDVLLYFSLIVFVLGFFLSSKLMAIEMMAVLQLAFIGLIMIDKLQALLAPFVNLYLVNGYNGLFTDTTYDHPVRVQAPGYAAYFLTNFNLDFVIVGLPVLLGSVVWLVGWCQDNKKTKRLGSRLMKQYQLAGLLLVMYHLVVSVCLGFMYGMEQVVGPVLGMVVLVGLAVETWLFYFRPLNFGQWKDFFNGKRENGALMLNFYIIIIIFRLALIVCMCALNEYPECVYTSIAISLLQVIVLGVVRPYLSNIRPIFNSIMVLLIFIVYAIYRLSITDDSSWITTYLPFILVILLYIAVIVNAIFMVKHLLTECRRNTDQRYAKKQVEFQMHDTTLLKNAEKNWKMIHDLKLSLNPHPVFSLQTPVSRMSRKSVFMIDDLHSPSKFQDGKDDQI